MNPSRRALAGVALVSLATGAHCSFVFVEGPPPGHEHMPIFDCTSSKALPSVDMGLTGLMALSLLGQASDQTSTREEALVTAGLGAAALVSSLWGFQKVDRCLEAKTDLASRIMRKPRPDVAPAQGPTPPGIDPWLSFGAPPGGSSPRPQRPVPDAGANPEGEAPPPPPTSSPTWPPSWSPSWPPPPPPEPSSPPQVPAPAPSAPAPAPTPTPTPTWPPPPPPLEGANP